VVEEGVRRVSVETIAAIYGGVAGAIVSGIFGIAILFIGRVLRRLGGVKFTPPNDWRSAFFEWEGRGRSVTPSRDVLEQSEYRQRRPEDRLDSVNCFAYAFTATLLNRMDVGAALSDVQVDFMKNGVAVFSHSPFDEESTDDSSGFLFEEGYRDVVADLGEKARPPGEGVEPIGPIALPSHIPVQKKLRGYIGPHSGTASELHHLKGGCDEVRLRAIRENGEPFNEHVVSLKPAAH
jgi:hypothetical protein